MEGAAAWRLGRPRDESQSVALLTREVAPILDHAICMEALERFHAEPQLMVIPVVNDRHLPVALIDRHTFVEFHSRMYSRELFGRRTLRQMLEEDTLSFPVSKPLVVDVGTSIDDVAQIIINAGMQHMVSGLAVTRQGKYVGTINGHDLFNEITRRRQEDLFYLAHYDSLTQIPNRMLFTDRLTQACLEAKRNGGLLALMFVDVDRFKQINDSLGHRFGDLLLQGVARRLRACLRECDTLARLGGDEFAILMEGIGSHEDAGILAERLVDTMHKPFNILDRSIRVTLSIGIALFPRDDTDVGALLSKADAAMYEVKISGRNGFRHFAPDISTYSKEMLGLESDLKQALANEEFFLCYQPQLSLATGEVRGVEALIRWRHPVRGVLTPGSFIGLAEESGLIVPIGDWVLAHACAQARAWREEGLPSLRMAVNISALQFRQPDFVPRVKTLLESGCLEPHLLELELTESMVMSRAPQVCETLDLLQSLGVHLSLDDFGTGFSSLGYLHRFPINRLKVDQSFVRGAHEAPVNASIIRAIVALAGSLSIEVVAEGVESEAELNLVKACGCDESQGYYHAPPMLAHELAAWLRGRLA